MIEQIFKQGDHEIKIETAETIEDAQKNRFPEGIYVRYFLDGKPVENYMALIRFITTEAKANNSKLIEDRDGLMSAREEMLLNQEKIRIKSLEDLKTTYKKMGVPINVIKDIDSMINKTNAIGVRTVE